MKTRRSVPEKVKEDEEDMDRRLSPRKKKRVEYNTDEACPIDCHSELEEEDKQNNGDDRQHSKDCIACEGHMFSPNAFENYGGKGQAKKWRSTISYNHKPLQFWINQGELSSPQFKRGPSAGSKWSDHKTSRHKGTLVESDSENDQDELNLDEKPEGTKEELLNTENGKGRITVTGIKAITLQKKPKLVLKKLPAEAEVLHVEEDVHTEDSLGAEKLSESQENSEDIEDKEDDTSSPKDLQNGNTDCDVETVPSPTCVLSSVDVVSPDVTGPDPDQQMPMERFPQSHSPSPIKDTPASTLLSSSELDMMDFDQLKSHEEDKRNSSLSFPKQAEVPHVVEDSLSGAEKAQAQDNSEDTEDKEADTSSPKDLQNENAGCDVEMVPFPTHMQSPVEDTSQDMTDLDPVQQMLIERTPQSHSPNSMKDILSSSEPELEQLKDYEDDKCNMSAGESNHNKQNKLPAETKEEKVDVEIGQNIRKTMLKKKPKLVLKKLPQHILNSFRQDLQSSDVLLNGRPLPKTEKVQDLETDNQNDNAEGEVQNAAPPSTTHVQSPVVDTLPDVIDQDPAQQELMERPPQSRSPSPSPINDASVPIPLTNPELDTMDLEQLKREKVKLQLKVLKLQEEYYSLQLKKMKE